jgi:hypothetical protein
MKNLISLILLTFICYPALAQADKSEKQERKTEIRERNDERMAKSKEKVDYNLFRRQMLGLKEYAEERKKIPELQKALKTPARIVVYIDSLNDGEDNKMLTGYIREDAGDNSANVYEITYDRVQKKIIVVKPTGETIELEKEEGSERKTKTIRKKNADDDDDADDDEKPSKTKRKEKDDD